MAPFRAKSYGKKQEIHIESKFIDRLEGFLLPKLFLGITGIFTKIRQEFRIKKSWIDL
jgi:hypothetical protein